MSVKINDKEYYGIIYKIENTANNKVYIGQTIHKRGFNGRYECRGNGIERVYNYHKNRKNNNKDYNVYLLNSIEKYGFDAFVVDEVFDTANSLDELNEKEKYYIEKFDSFYNGYNRTLGGEGMLGYATPSGKNNKFSMRVCQISPDNRLIKIWDSLGDIKRALGISGGAISNVCLGRKETSAGFVWVYEKDYDPNNDYSRTPKTRGGGKSTSKPILLLDSNNNVIKEFASGVIAAEELGINKKEVSKICTYIRKNPKYNLIFKSEYLEKQRLNVEGSYVEVA